MKLRMSRLGLICFIVGIGVLCSESSFAQSTGTLRIGDACDYTGENVIPNVIQTFAPNDEVERNIRKVARALSVNPNTFKVHAANVPNAAAAIQGLTRYILYSPRFMHDIKRATGTPWAALSILAHEIGHHTNGHTLDRRGSRPQSEIDADWTSGKAMGHMGATLEEAQAAIMAFGNNRGSSTHPPKKDRLAAIEDGWYAARESNSDSTPSSNPKRLPKTSACEYENDGQCDVPEHCPWGTDVNDCTGLHYPGQSQPRMTDICCCQFAPQRFPGLAAPVGSYCQCQDAFGRVYPGKMCLLY